MNNDIENTLFNGSIAIKQHPTDPQTFGDGSLELEGTLYTSIVRPYNPESAIDIDSVTIQDGTVGIKNGPKLVPGTGGQLAYQIGNDVFDVHVNQNAGDIFTHNGIRQSALQIGGNGHVLSVDSSVPTKLKWVAPATSLNLTSKGDIPVMTSTGLSKITPGQNGHVLIADSTSQTGYAWTEMSQNIGTITTTFNSVRNAMMLQQWFSGQNTFTSVSNEYSTIHTLSITIPENTNHVFKVHYNALFLSRQNNTGVLTRLRCTGPDNANHVLEEIYTETPVVPENRANPPTYICSTVGTPVLGSGTWNFILEMASPEQIQVELGNVFFEIQRMTSLQNTPDPAPTILGPTFSGIVDALRLQQWYSAESVFSNSSSQYSSLHVLTTNVPTGSNYTFRAHYHAVFLERQNNTGVLTRIKCAGPSNTEHILGEIYTETPVVRENVGLPPTSISCTVGTPALGPGIWDFILEFASPENTTITLGNVFFEIQRTS